MLVERIMTSPVRTLAPDNSIEEALNMMAKYSFRHVPIVNENEKLVGIVSDRDIKMTLPSVLSDDDPDMKLDEPLSRIMRTNVTYCHPLDFVEEIALDFYHFSIGAIPVVREGRLVGIVTQKDMLNTFLELTGIKEPGSIIEIDSEDRTGVIHDIGKIFKDLNIRIISVSVYTNKETKGNKIIVLRVRAMNPRFAIEKLQNEGFKVLTPDKMGTL
ncbi:CBS and ACT domain-containing protein [Lacicoccus alkaliphilus]|uniref:Acetoin utilization protein AcuB n=1 Tax=Lacicoccus alkaliphilus DSM 16010 TaxID=1123231 RepID=A0A1M7AI09_9BACL|nr:CBS and ACT domain-containing protein [Salinicoccus alkaliphilus]SHL42382.1 acetoin utilization protein AcuB [Salinicoccus alkaliphilus DSM 16010]